MALLRLAAPKRASKEAIAGIRCKSALLDAYINWNDYLGSEVDVHCASVRQAKVGDMSSDSTPVSSSMQLVDALFDEIDWLRRSLRTTKVPSLRFLTLRVIHLWERSCKRCLAAMIKKVFQHETERNASRFRTRPKVSGGGARWRLGFT